MLFQLPEILEELIKLVLNSEMPCFHPESVIFLTNKWDLVELQAEDDEEVTQVWERLKSDLQRRWPSVSEEHIFRLNLKEVMLFTETKFNQYDIFTCFSFTVID